MKSSSTRFLAGAILILGIGLLANAAALFYSGRGTAGLATPANAAAEQQQQYFVLQQDTYLVTTNEDGRRAYLWYFDYSPRREDTTLTHVKSASAP